MTTIEATTKAQTAALAWLRKGAGEKFYDNPSFRRVPLRYAFVDAACGKYHARKLKRGR